MSEFNSILVPADVPQTLEIDPSCKAVYIRFKNSRVHKTISGHQAKDCIVNFDLDSKNAVIGIELVGEKEFSITAIRRRLPERMRDIDFERARFVVLSPVDAEMAQA